MAEVTKVDDSTFESEIINSDKPAVVDFSAEWCGPCKMLAPTIEQLAGEYAGKVKVATVDVDESRQTAAKYGVSSVPTVIFFKNGKEVDRVIGVRPKAEIVEKIDSLQ